MERLGPGRLEFVVSGRGATSRRRLWKASSSETRPKVTSRFWDAYPESAAPAAGRDSRPIGKRGGARMRA